MYPNFWHLALYSRPQHFDAIQMGGFLNHTFILVTGVWINSRVSHVFPPGQRVFRHFVPDPPPPPVVKTPLHTPNFFFRPPSCRWNSQAFLNRLWRLFSELPFFSSLSNTRRWSAFQLVFFFLRRILPLLSLLSSRPV